MKRDYPRLLISDKRGNISSHPSLGGAGMAGGHFFSLNPDDMIRLPPGSRLFMTPSRLPVGYDHISGNFEIIDDKYLSVAAFISPGYTATHSASYSCRGKPKPLPLFSYAAAALYRNEVFVGAVRVDRDRRHDSRFIDMARVRKNIAQFRKIFHPNRIVRHLERCALAYGCCGAQNFFLSRCEGPLPASPLCNAACAGCISHKSRNVSQASQPRISFIPTSLELSQIALFHIGKVKDAVVSFGQGCDGEPLLVGDIIEKSIALIRRKTSNGLINMNTNGSRPETLGRLFDAGLDSIRLSLNSVRELYYKRYYRPAGYTFRDVIKSVRIAKGKRRFVSINYLTMPGFTDSEEEFAALKSFIRDYGIDMIQWRNLNHDPLLYFEELRVNIGRDKIIGIRQVIESLKGSFPNLMMGYFNPTGRKIACR